MFANVIDSLSYPLAAVPTRGVANLSLRASLKLKSCCAQPVNNPDPSLAIPFTALSAFVIGFAVAPHEGPWPLVPGAYPARVDSVSET